MAGVVKAKLKQWEAPTATEDDLRLIEGLVENDGRDVLVGLLTRMVKAVPQRELRREQAGREE